MSTTTTDSLPNPPPGVEVDHPLWRLTTVRTGGNADYFAAPDSTGLLVDLLNWADLNEIRVGVIGSGSNLLVSDDGFRGLALKLAGDLTEVERSGTSLVCGGGARLPSVAAKSASWGLAGLEFGVNIPGTAGGAVRMNANAYGGRLVDVLERVEICSASGVGTVEPDKLGLSYRHSNLTEGQVVSRVFFSLTEDTSEAIKQRLAEMRAWRREAQPSGIKTFGSTFKNPEDPRAEGRSAGQLLDAAGCRGMTIGGARLSEKHANFVDNMGEASTADVIAVMSAARRRVRDEFGVTLEPEVQVMGEVEWPAELQESVESSPDGVDPDQAGERDLG
ncbi:MAG: UDP-N-acetylmuramate dehydrogenase [Solirubrobacterales bacterium]